MPLLFLILGLLVLGYACLTFDHPLVRKGGLLAFMAATFALFHGLSGSLLLGCFGIALWFGLPWIELLTRVRHLELPLDKPFRRRIPPREDFPNLPDATEEIEAAGPFELVDDWGYEWMGTEHFFRLFYDASTRTQAAICMTRDEHLVQSYVKLVTRTQQGEVFTTWNYPFCAGLKLSPNQRLHWDRASDTFLGIFEEHQHFLQEAGVPSSEITEQEPEALLNGFKQDQRQQMDHNVALGVLRTSGDGMCRYTWRGLVFLWAQLVKEFVRLH